MSETAAVARWIAELEWEDIPPEVIAQAKRCLIDFLACATGGACSEPGRISASRALHWGGPEEATVIGAQHRVAARHAAFANATMANALDFDDTLFGHPGATTFPAALAAAEKWKRSGKEFVLAVVVGYELSVRAMALLQPLIPRYQAMWDLGTLQAYGAVAAAARLAGCDAAGIANALGLLSGTTPLPLPRKQRYPGEGRSMLKSAYGWATDAAIVAVEMTEGGFSGPGHALDDNMGFWTVAPSDRLEVSSFSEKLGQSWAIMDVAFKPFMACRFIHPVLQGVEEILKQEPIAPEEVEQVEISSFSLLGDEHHYILEPVSGTDAQFSVPFTVAATLLSGGLTPDSYEAHTLRSPEVQALARQVVVNVDPEYEKAYPGRLGAHVRIIGRDGRTRESRIDDPRGTAEQPLTAEALDEKFRSLAEPLLGAGGTDELAVAAETIEELSSIESFTRLLRPTSAESG
jgi:2-methylcitrate dehydratase PrpD